MDLYNEILKQLDLLDGKIKSLVRTGREYAEAHMNARMKLSEALLRLEAEGRPVTNLYYIARGLVDVARAKFDEISKEAIYKANDHSIQSTKLRIRVLERQLEREWGNPKGD